MYDGSGPGGIAPIMPGMFSPAGSVNPADYQAFLEMQQMQAYMLMQQNAQLAPIQQHTAESWRENKKRKYLGLSNQCPMCERSFKGQEGLDAHLQDKHGMANIEEGSVVQKKAKAESTEKPFTCAVCGKSFAQEQSLIDHCKSAHPGTQIATGSTTPVEVVKSFTCGLCGKSFGQEQSLADHCKNVHPSDTTTTDSTAVCKDFTPTAKPFACTMCGKSFAREDSLTDHCKGAHPGTQIATDSTAVAGVAKPFVCPHCSKSFLLEQGLIDHCKNVHAQGGAATTLPDAKPHKCPDCGKAFKDVEQIFDHAHAVHGGPARAKTSLRQREVRDPTLPKQTPGEAGYTGCRKCGSLEHLQANCPDAQVQEAEKPAST